MNKKYRVNNEITAPEVRVIAPDGKQLGIKPINVALELASSYDMDLVEIAPQATPPVCKIIDYSKFKYQQEKLLHEKLKKQRTFHLKEIRFKPKISPHDYEFKIKHVKEFLAKNYPVKITILLSSGPMILQENAMKLLEKIKSDLSGLNLNMTEKTDEKRITLTLTPKKT